MSDFIFIYDTVESTIRKYVCQIAHVKTNECMRNENVMRVVFIWLAQISANINKLYVKLLQGQKSPPLFIVYIIYPTCLSVELIFTLNTFLQLSSSAIFQLVFNVNNICLFAFKLCTNRYCSAFATQFNKKLSSLLLVCFSKVVMLLGVYSRSFNHMSYSTIQILVQRRINLLNSY